MYRQKFVHPSEKKVKVIEYDNEDYVSMRELTALMSEKEEELSDEYDQARGIDGSQEEEAETAAERKRFLEFKKWLIERGIIYKTPNKL